MVADQQACHRERELRRELPVALRGGEDLTGRELGKDWRARERDACQAEGDLANQFYGRPGNEKGLRNGKPEKEKAAHGGLRRDR